MSKLRDRRARDLQTTAGWMLVAASAPAASDGMMIVGGAGFAPIVVSSLEWVAGITGLATMILMLAAKLKHDTGSKAAAAELAALQEDVEPVLFAPAARPSFRQPQPIYRPAPPAPSPAPAAARGPVT